MTISNKSVIERWINGRRGGTYYLKTDGKNLHSDSVLIGITKKKKKILYDYSYANGVNSRYSHPLLSHVNRVKWVVGDSISDKDTCFDLGACYYHEGPSECSGFSASIHMEEYCCNFKEINEGNYIFGDHITEITKVLSRFEIFDIRKDWKKHCKVIQETGRLCFSFGNYKKVIDSWIEGFGWQSNNIRTDGFDLISRWTKLGYTKGKKKVLYDYTKKGGKYISSHISCKVNYAKLRLNESNVPFKLVRKK